MPHLLSRCTAPRVYGAIAALLVGTLILSGCGELAAGAPAALAPLPTPTHRPPPTATPVVSPTLVVPLTVTPPPPTATVPHVPPGATPPPPAPPTATPPPPAPPTATPRPAPTPLPPGTIINITGIIQQIIVQNNITVIVVNNIHYTLPPSWIVILGPRLRVGVPIACRVQYNPGGQIVVINVAYINNTVVVVNSPEQEHGKKPKKAKKEKKQKDDQGEDD